MSAVRRLAVVLFCGAAAVALGPGGCGGDGVGGGPVPVGGGGASSGGSGGVSGGGGGMAPVPWRTVEQRNPFGDVAATTNLLWDGDFEWRSAFADQYGWLSGTSMNSISMALPALEMGARCKSGVKCARLDAGHVILGLAVSSKGHQLAISFWAAPTTGDCHGMESTFFTDSNAEPGVEVPPVSDGAGGSGWCHYVAVADERHSAGYLLIHNSSGEQAIVDDAVIVPVEPDAQTVRSAGGERPAPVSPWMRAWAYAATRPRVTPPNEARVRFERKMRSTRWR